MERLTAKSDKVDGDHRSFHLDTYLDLPAKKEIDLEGLARQGDYLWVAGSHSVVRDKDSLAIKKKGNNRYFLARFPIQQEDGQVTLAPKVGLP